ncbi:MAG: DUF4388 domain-containing protein [Pseudopedobacter sp.]|nr:DUF4388 domain-containing protein [Deinococcales bacterium]
MAIELSGQLSEDVLGNLLQYLSLNLASGCLQVRRSPTQQSEVFFEQGKVVHAYTGATKGVQALALLMAWNSGSFQFRAGVAPPERTINLPLDSLLLEAAYNADMAALSAEQTSSDLLGENAVLVASSPPAESNVALSLRAVLLLRQLDSKTSLIEIADRMALEVSEIVVLAGELMNQNLADIAASPIISTEFVREMVQLVIDIMGPMGEIVVDDAVYDLGLEQNAIPESSLSELLTEIKAQFKRDDWRREFEIQIRRLQDRFRLRA